MKKIASYRVPYSEFLKFIPHPVIVESMINKYPVIIEKVPELDKKRLILGKLIP